MISIQNFFCSVSTINWEKDLKMEKKYVLVYLAMFALICPLSSSISCADTTYNCCMLPTGVILDRFEEVCVSNVLTFANGQLARVFLFSAICNFEYYNDPNVSNEDICTCIRDCTCDLKGAECTAILIPCKYL